MNEAVGDTVGGVDACLFLTEPRGELNEQELQLLEMFKKQKMPVILAINKIDMILRRSFLSALPKATMLTSLLTNLISLLLNRLTFSLTTP